MRSFIVFIAAMLLTSCAKMEYEEIANNPAPDMNGSACNVAMNSEGQDGQVYSLYFMDKTTKKIRAKFRKVLNEPRWYYQEVDSVENYKVLSDAAHPYLMQNNNELGELKLSFIYEGDTIRIYRCGEYPLENPKYFLLAVTIKGGTSE